MAKDLRIAIVGLGPFGREAEKILSGDVRELLIVAKDSTYLEKFTRPESYNPNVWPLKGDIDETSVLGGLIGLEIIPPEAEAEEEKNSNDIDKKKTIDIAIVDMGDISGEINDFVVERISPYAETIIVPTRHPAHIKAFEKLVGKESTLIVFCPEKEAAERIVPRVLHDLDIGDISKVSPNLYEATIDVTEGFTGRSVRQIHEEYGVRVVFFVKSLPKHKGRKKEIIGYDYEEFFPEDASYCILEEDTSMRVLGTFSQIKKLKYKTE